MKFLDNPVKIFLENLVFDLESPRLPEKPETQEAMLELLLEIGVLQELMISIGHQGQNPSHPLQVVALGEGKYMVVDGNRRLAALKLLRNPDLCKHNSVDKIAFGAPHTPSEVTCVVSLKRDAIIKSMAFDHVSSPIQWGMLAKARYFSESKDNIAGLSMSTGTRKSYVDRLINVYAIFQRIVDAEFYGIEGLNEVSLSFPIIADILNYENTMNYVAFHGEQGLEDIVRWRFETVDGFRRIGSEQHADLNKIMASEKALKLFREGALFDQCLIVVNMERWRDHEKNDKSGAQRPRSD